MWKGVIRLQEVLADIIADTMSADIIPLNYDYQLMEGEMGWDITAMERKVGRQNSGIAAATRT
jgi:hypothetical protein